MNIVITIKNEAIVFFDDLTISQVMTGILIGVMMLAVLGLFVYLVRQRLQFALALACVFIMTMYLFTLFYAIYRTEEKFLYNSMVISEAIILIACTVFILFGADIMNQLEQKRR